MLSYPQLLNNLESHFLREEPLAELPDELTLQSLWFNGQFGKTFEDTEGNTIQIKQFGFWNRAAGPDFLHASIEFNGETRSGPLEIDTHASDWETHGHHSNKNFNDVILHIVFKDNGNAVSFTRTSNHRHIPRVVIPQQVVQKALQQPRFAQATAHIGKCYQPLLKLNPTSLNQLLLNAAEHRCALKAKRLVNIAEAHGEDQALWIALAETLGYRPNKQTMGHLAQRIPIRYLRKNTHLSIPLLFGVSNFLHPTIHQKAPLDSQEWLQTMWEEWWKVRDKHELSEERSLQWTRSGIRPINHPHRRLATLALIAKHWPNFKKLSSQTDKIQQWLESLTDPFWSHHYTLTSRRSENALALIGKDRVTDLLLNHLLPLRIHKGDKTAWEQYQKLRAPAISESIKRVSTRLLGDRTDKKDFLKFAWQHQGLLQIYHDFCLEDISDCENCPFPESLAKILQHSNLS